MNVVFATISEETEKKIIKQILREKIMCQITIKLKNYFKTRNCSITKAHCSQYKIGRKYFCKLIVYVTERKPLYSVKTCMPFGGKIRCREHLISYLRFYYICRLIVFHWRERFAKLKVKQKTI